MDTEIFWRAIMPQQFVGHFFMNNGSPPGIETWAHYIHQQPAYILRMISVVKNIIRGNRFYRTAAQAKCKRNNGSPA